MAKREQVNSLLKLTELLASDTSDLYLLFADLVGSTEYKHHLVENDLPDITWILRQLTFLNRASEVIKDYNGTIVKTIGDEIFACFSATTNPQSIIKCSIEVIQAFDNLKTFKDNSKIRTKISIDFELTYNGTIMNNIPYDPIGVPVDRCARLNSLAKENEIIFSNFVYEIMEEKDLTKNLREIYGIEKQNENLKGLGLVEYYKINV